jgi:hypothetical protein
MSVACGVRFAYVVGYYELPFVMSLYLQQVRGLSLATGVVFLPTMLIGAILPCSARAPLSASVHARSSILARC